MPRSRISSRPTAVRLTLSSVALVSALGLAPSLADARPGCHVVVYEDANLSGASDDVTDDQPLVRPDLNDQISSIRVFAGRWSFFKNSDFNGPALRYGPGTYSTIPAAWNDQISSMKCVAGPVGPGVGPGPTDVYDYGGRSYGWYDGGWNGPGFYIVGFAYRYGRGFGGRDGVHGWHHHGRDGARNDHHGDHHDGHGHRGGRALHPNRGGHDHPHLAPGSGGARPGGGHQGGGGGRHGGGAHHGGGGGHHGGGGGGHHGGGGHRR